MNYQLIPSSAHLTTNWNGGTTTQLFIHPPESSVEARDFDFRISTATVEAESSTFTPFKGYHRTLLILEGSIQIHHEGHHQKELKQFDQDGFNGDWNTKAVGKCVDFNVITKGGLTNSIAASAFLKNDRKQVSISADWVFVYIHSGEVVIRQHADNCVLMEGTVLAISEVEKGFLEVLAKEDSEVVLVQLSKKEAKV